MIRLLMGGSPCTYWSIAKTKNRETEASGLGWELFQNFLIARDKYKPDFFLYENNKSMSAAIRAQITRELGMEPVCINSALVSAQNRQRLYWIGRREPDGTYTQVPVEQPEDRGILLRDILESGASFLEKGYTLKANYTNASPANAVDTNHFPVTMVAEPVRIGTIESEAKRQDFDSQQYRVYSPDGKSVTLCGQGGGVGGKDRAVCRAHAGAGGDTAGIFNSKTRRGRAMKAKSNCLTTSCSFYEYCGTLDRPIYRVAGGRITINGREYPIKLADGCYIIRKLTVTECKRLQTVPEEYRFPVSDTQAYKMLGNGWTVEVICHLLSHIPGIADEDLEVLSMYDGMSCGNIAMGRLGAKVTAYYATEIDKYAIQTTQLNYPETIQLGDAFQVRNDGWRLDPGTQKTNHTSERTERNEQRSEYRPV